MLEMSVNGLVERKDYSKIRANIDIPDLIGIQKRSYEQFLQLETDPDRREDDVRARTEGRPGAESVDPSVPAHRAGYD